MLKLRIVLSFGLIAIPVIMISQTGPGGAGSTIDNALWLRANTGTIGNNNTDPVSSWSDQSGNANNVWQANADQQPLFIDNFINGYPSIRFDNNFGGGQNDFFEGASSNTLDNTDGLTMFSVTQRDDLSNARSIVGKRTNVGVNQSYMFFYWTNDQINVDIVGNNDRFTTNPFSFGTGTNRILNMRYDGTLPAASRATVFNGEQLLTTATESSAFIPGFVSPLIVGATHVGDGRAFGGYISEIIIYRKAVNIAERILVNNYLSAKYNIPLTANDVYTMDNPAFANYDHEVAGIGRINALNISADGQGSDLVRILNPTNLGDNEFFMWGHDNGIAQAINFTDIPAGVWGRFDRVWRASELSPLGAAVDVGSVDIRFDLNGLGAVTAAELRLLVDVNNNGVFIDDPAISGATDLGGGIFQFAGINQIQHSFRFTLASIAVTTPLPVELTEWRVECTEEGVLAQWTTESETNNDYFTLERSFDGASWTKVKELQGAGNSSQTNQYEFLDKNVKQLVYYRLKQVDFNGSSTVFAIKSAPCYMDAWDKISIYPNPASQNVTIESPFDDFEVRILDVQGKLLKSVLVDQPILQVDLSNFSNGVYLFEFLSSKGRHTKRVVVQN